MPARENKCTGREENTAAAAAVRDMHEEQNSA